MKTTALTLMLILAATPLTAAETAATQVVGVSDHTSRGARSPALRHRDCAATYPGSHWCSTREFLEGGLAEDLSVTLPMAWIRPTVVGGYGNGRNEVIFIDAAGIKAAKVNLNCLQWSTSDNDYKGLALRSSDDGIRQKVIQTECSRRLPALCCGTVTP